VLEVNEAVEFTNTADSILGLNSFGSNGFLNVRLNSGEIVSLAQYCKVDEVKFNHNKTREEFRILEWPFENKLASVSCERIGKSRFAAISYEPQAKIYFNKALGILTIGLELMPAYTSTSNPISSGTHKIWLPDYPHDLAENYLSSTKFALIWFRLGDESSTRYLHVGNVSAGCVSVGKSSSSDSNPKNELWTSIYQYLAKKRMNSKWIGELIVT
jgi:hypothetical protein